jgi:hypothetical protein
MWFLADRGDRLVNLRTKLLPAKPVAALLRVVADVKTALATSVGDNMVRGRKSSVADALRNEGSSDGAVVDEGLCSHTHSSTTTWKDSIVAGTDTRGSCCQQLALLSPRLITYRIHDIVKILLLH